MKKSNKDKLKKQIVSGGIYIALAAAVVTVTLNGVNNIIGSNKDYEIPEINLEIPEIDNEDFWHNINTDRSTSGILGNGNINHSEQKQDSGLDTTDDKVSKESLEILPDVTSEENVYQSGNSYEGVTSEVIENSSDNMTSAPSNEVTVSGEPDDIEYPTEPDPKSYAVYAKPAEGYIDKAFSDNELIYSVTMGDYRTHNGVDITGDPGSPVKAINSGVVEDIYSDDFYGFTVKINHGNGMIAYYMNLSESLPADVEVGSKVSHGQIIGGIGNTSTLECAEVSHLHLSVTVNGTYVNPEEILRSNN